MPPKKKTDLEGTIRQLAETRAKLERCEAGQNVRGKEKKIDGLKKSIVELELKASQLNAMPGPTLMANSTAGLPGAMQIIQSSVMATTSGPIPMIKPEEINLSISSNCPGSKQHPMQIDCEEEAELNCTSVSRLHRSDNSPEDNVMSEPQRLPISLDTPSSVANLHGGNYISQFIFPELDQLTATGSHVIADTVQYHNFVEPPQQLNENNQGEQRVNLHQDHNMDVDDTGSDSAGGLMREAVPTTNEALALAIFRSIQDHDIGVDDTGSDSAGGLMREAVPTTNEALVLRTPHSVCDPGSQGNQHVNVLQDHDMGGLVRGARPTNEACAPTSKVMPPTDEAINPTQRINWPPEHGEVGARETSPLENLEESGNLGLDRLGQNWVWNGKCDVNIDEDLYSFTIEKYDPRNDHFDEAATSVINTESQQTGVLRRDWENQLGTLAHYEQQRKQLQSKQQSLFQSLSEGFAGDLKSTRAHVIAISRTCKDIETVGSYITAISNHAKAKQYEFLTSCNEDDHFVMVDAQDTLKGAQERLENTDPGETEVIQREQAMIRLTKQRIGLLQTAIEERAHTMNELAALAKALPDGEIPGQSDPLEVAAGSCRKGMTKRKATGKDRSTHQQVESIAGSEVNGHHFPTLSLFPAVQTGQSAQAMIDNAEPPASSTVTDAAVDALKSLDKYLKTSDPKLFRFKFRKQAREQVEFFPDASFTSMDVTKLVFESSQSQSLCEYHRKGKSNTFKADSAIELFGMGFKGQSVGDSSKLTVPLDGHLHCGCPIREVAMEYFLWKTTRAFSSNPRLAGRTYAMEELSKLKPSTRTFWNKSIWDYTGLQTEDLLSGDYGSDMFAIRIAIIQLHTQIERLRALRAPLMVQVVFPDLLTNNLPEHLAQYSMDMIATTKQLEDFWGNLKRRRVSPLPFITPTRKA